MLLAKLKNKVTHLPVLHKEGERPGGREGCVSVSSEPKVEVRKPKSGCSTPLITTWTPIRPTCAYAFPMTISVKLQVCAKEVLDLFLGRGKGVMMAKL